MTLNPFAHVDGVPAMRLAVAKLVQAMASLERRRHEAETFEQLSAVTELVDVVDALRVSALDRLRTLEAERAGGAA